MDSAGRWDPETYPPSPHYYPTGIETPRTWINLTAGIFNRGYSQKTVAKVTAENWLRVFRECWQVDIHLS